MNNSKKIIGHTVFFITMILSTLWGCAEQAVKPVVVKDPPKVIVFPVFSVVKEFRPYNDKIYDSIIKQLGSVGYDSFVVNEQRYHDIRGVALEQSGAIYNPVVGDFVPYKEGAYVASVIEQLASTADFDLLLLPELILRKAHIEGDDLVWDGVRHSQILRGDPGGTYRTPKEAHGLSLKLGLYTRNAREEMVNYAGLVIPYYLNLEESPPNYRLREQLFENDELDLAVERALQTLKTKSN